MPRPQGQIERVLAELAVRPHQAQQRRRRQLSDTRTGEVDQQVRVPFSGTVSATPAYQDVTVVWEQPFLYAPNQRRVPFETPHFTSGFEVTQAPVDGAGAVVWMALDAHVLAWTQSPELWYVGATVRLGAVAPAVAGAPVAFAALAHLTFEGYATYGENAGDALPAPTDGG